MAPEPTQLGCSVERSVRGTGSLLKLNGQIDQTFDSMIFSQQSEGTTIIDLDGVSRITSFGVREWNKAIQLVNAAYLGFINVRPAMVIQFNVVSGVSGNGQIVSLFAPFICPACQATFERLFDLRTDYVALTQLEGNPPPCPECAQPSELDELPSVYFGFVKRQGPPTPPHDFDTVLNGGTGGEAPASATTSTERVQQEVEGNDTYLWLTGPLDAGLGLRRLVDSLEGTVVVVLQAANAKGTGVDLERLLRYPGSLHFARVPLELRDALRRAGAAPHIGSWWLSVVCPNCENTVDLEVDQASAHPEACPHCNATLVLPADIVTLVAELSPLPAPVSASLLGRTGPRKAVGRGAFLSRFEVIRKIGTGGMGEVYLARMQGLGRFEKQVALKRILAGAVKAANAVETFLSEARLAARLSHRNVVQIFDVGHERGEFYIALEYVDGVDLRTLFNICERTKQLIPPAIAMQLIADIAGGLSAAHTHIGPDGTNQVIVHRDVSPHNIMVSTAGEAKITDFGIAKMESDPDQTPKSVTKGKLSYLAPEQVRREGGRIEPRSDLFSLGVVLYQALTLQHPFAKMNAYETLKAVLEVPIPSVSVHRENLPLVDAIIARATAKELEARYATAEAMRLDLMAAIGSPAPDVGAWLRPILKNKLPPAPVNPGSWTRQTARHDDEPTK